MSLSNKTFKNNKTGETIRVIDSFENVAILENKSKESVTNLLNPDLYTEQIDISNFFNTQGAYNTLADKIKNIPTDQIKDEPGEIMVSVDGNNQFKPQTNESAVMQVSEEDERAELARKYGFESNKQNDMDKQNQAFDKLLNPESNEKNNKTQMSNSNLVQNTIQSVEDPIITMFKNVKRNKDFSISFEIKNKIPRPDFIEMMEDSYNTSIIDFLASEFTDNLLRNPQIIEDIIRQKIKEVVYGVENKTVNPQITDSITQENTTSDEIEVEKPKPTRKSKANVDQSEKPIKSTRKKEPAEK